MLAIVIPYYKIRFFQATLESLAQQSNKDFKVYIGDDASKEDPSILLEKYNGKIDFSYQRFDANLGGQSLVKQWERCIALAENEEWVMILGDDDVLSENAVEEFYNHFQEIQDEKIAVVRYATYKINEEGSLISAVYQHPRIENSIDSFFRKTRSSLSEYIFRKEKIQKIRFKDFPLAWFSDVLAVMEFSDFKNLFTLNNAAVYVRISSESISGSSSFNAQKLEAGFRFYIYLLDKHLRYFNPAQINYLLEKTYNCYLTNKKVISFLLRITKLHLKKGWIRSYFSFITTIVKRVLRQSK